MNKPDVNVGRIDNSIVIRVKYLEDCCEYLVSQCVVVIVCLLVNLWFSVFDSRLWRLRSLHMTRESMMRIQIVKEIICGSVVINLRPYVRFEGTFLFF